MNKSKIAYEIINDIYSLNAKYEKAKTKFEASKIDTTKFAKVQYILICKLEYLKMVIQTMQKQDYKFARYEKELSILTDLQDSIEETFNPQDLDSLSIAENFNLVTYLTKYERIVDLIEFEELKEKVEHN
ncbi:MAG: hypothetical protein J6Q13_01350 [Clostridia bacterium]|nr:hypothetical protein [Clostridia bacterium]